jgi:hypothetical protein
MDETTRPSGPSSSPECAPALPQENSAAANGINNLRLSRIAQHRAESQEDPSALVAALCGVNADLFELAHYVAQPLLATLGAGPITIEDLDDKGPAINQLIRLAKQSAQIAQIIRQCSTPVGTESAADRAGLKRRNRDLLPNSAEDISPPPV